MKVGFDGFLGKTKSVFYFFNLDLSAFTMVHAYGSPEKQLDSNPGNLEKNAELGDSGAIPVKF